jgi:hypothetical protein
MNQSSKTVLIRGEGARWERIVADERPESEDGENGVVAGDSWGDSILDDSLKACL